jgi:hypothetical protein
MREEVSSVLRQKIIELTKIPEAYWKVEVKDGNCQVKDENWIEKLTKQEKLAM